MNLSEFWVIMFFEQAEPQSEGSRHTDHIVKLPPAKSNWTAGSSINESVALLVLLRLAALLGIVRSGPSEWKGSCGLRQHEACVPSS